MTTDAPHHTPPSPARARLDRLVAALSTPTAISLTVVVALAALCLALGAVLYARWRERLRSGGEVGEGEGGGVSPVESEDVETEVVEVREKEGKNASYVSGAG